MMNKISWEYVPLEDLIEVHDGQRRPVTAKDRIQGQTPYCGANGVVDYVDGYTHNGEYLLLAEDGGRYGPGERSAYVMTGKFWANNHAHVLSPNSNRINLYYLLHYLNFSDLTSFLKGATRPKLNQGDMRKIPVLLPSPDNYALSLDIQNRLVYRLDSIFSELAEARRLHEKIIADTNRLMDAVLAEVYSISEERLPEGWGLLSLSDICAINPTRPRNLTQNDETMTSFVPMAAVDDREGRITDLQTRPFVDVKRGYTYFEENDVLFAKITPCMENGKAAIARGLINRFGFGSTEFHVLRPTNRILPEWIYYFVRRDAFRQEAKTKFRGAVGQQRVPADFLETHLIPVPFPQYPGKSLDIQQQIITRIQTTGDEIVEAQLGNTKTGALFKQMEQSVLAQAFRREL